MGFGHYLYFLYSPTAKVKSGACQGEAKLGHSGYPVRYPDIESTRR